MLCPLTPLLAGRVMSSRSFSVGGGRATGAVLAFDFMLAIPLPPFPPWRPTLSLLRRRWECAAFSDWRVARGRSSSSAEEDEAELREEYEILRRFAAGSAFKASLKNDDAGEAGCCSSSEGTVQCYELRILPVKVQLGYLEIQVCLKMGFLDFQVVSFVAVENQCLRSCSQNQEVCPHPLTRCQCSAVKSINRLYLIMGHVRIEQYILVSERE
jgi:hypothetical protein